MALLKLVPLIILHLQNLQCLSLELKRIFNLKLYIDITQSNEIILISRYRELI